MFEMEEITGGASPACIKVIGVGGAGGNVLNNMIASNIKSVEYIAINTDAQVLQTSMAARKIQIGKAVTRGLGAGSNPEVGKQSALEDKEQISELVSGADMVFITAGRGGGTGTGAAPVVAEIAREHGAITVGVVTKPFFYEGGVRKKNAEYGVRELSENVDTMIIIPNDRIVMVVERGTSLLESFAIANDVLRNAVQGISDLVLVPGLINLDFADVKTIVQGAGRAVIGMGTGSGEGGATDAAMKAINNPLLENSSIEGAEGVLINITGGLNLSLHDVQDATAPIYETANEHANIVMGAVIDPELKDEIRVTVIATRFDAAQDKQGVPIDSHKSRTVRPSEQKPAERAERNVLDKISEPAVASVSMAPVVEPDVIVSREKESEIQEAIEAMALEDDTVAEMVAETMDVVVENEVEVTVATTTEGSDDSLFPGYEDQRAASVSISKKKVSAINRPRRKRAMGVKGAERVLARTLAMSVKSDEDASPLDIPTFLRKPVMTTSRDMKHQ
jgi:cell division protein FtsZ